MADCRLLDSTRVKVCIVMVIKGDIYQLIRIRIIRIASHQSAHHLTIIIKRTCITTVGTLETFTGMVLVTVIFVSYVGFVKRKTYSGNN